ncbi:MAG TPA: OmpA family protein [Steroidobacteraceae bacterium]|nr:OmpA family protein [Steroidobacteraceae bacterium]
MSLLAQALARSGRAAAVVGALAGALAPMAAVPAAPMPAAAAIAPGGPSGSAPNIPLEQGLTFTVTSHVGLVSNRGSLPVADTEIVYSVESVDANRVRLRFLLSAEGGTAAGKLLQAAPTSFVRIIRREDVSSAMREKVLFGSDDPELLPGQTYAGTSAAVLAALQGTGKVAFVLGINEPEGGLAGLSGVAAAVPGAGAGSGVSPLVVSGLQMMLNSPARHYYRGTLVRVGPDEPFSVLLDGRRTTVPAVHVRGDMKFADRTITPELWWLDEPGNPLTLKWAIGGSYEIVTRIDRPPPAQGNGMKAGAMAGMAAALAGHDCRAELTGVYFTTASAQVLDVSLPALQRFAALLEQHPDWEVTIEGHTDNIGSAGYNLELSSRRAQAVRQALIGRFRVPAARLQAKGYGFTRPVESNATVQGRARNRRVEVSRRCSA